jgi:hypothetical protein
MNKKLETLFGNVVFHDNVHLCAKSLGTLSQSMTWSLQSTWSFG